MTQSIKADHPLAAASPPPAPVTRRTVRQDLAEVVHELRDSRDLLVQLTIRDIRIRYKQAVMGFGWAVFMPLVIVLAGCVVRVAMTNLSGGSLQRPEIGGLLVKALPWSFFVGALGFATASLVANATLVAKVYFAREVLPISAVLAQAVDALIAGVVVTLLLPFMGAQLTPALLWVPVLLLALLLLVLGLSVFLSCANLFFRDVKYIVQVLLTFGIFFTPVFFEPAMLGQTGARIAMLNPVAPILEGLRLAVIDGHNLLAPLQAASGVVIWEPWYLGYIALWSLGAPLVGAAVFHRAEFVFAEFV